MTIINISIACFGAFRKFGDSLCLDVPSGSSIADIKKALVHKLGHENSPLISDTAFADNTKILQDQDTLISTANLSALPPVCGG